MIAKIQIFSEIIARSHEKYTLFNEKDLPDAIRHFSTCLLSTVCNLAIIDCKIMGAHCLYNYDYYFFSAKLQKSYRIWLVFLKKLKIIAKKLGTFRNNAYLCTQNNGRVPFIGIGVSPIGRVVRFVATLFLCLLGWIDFEAQKFAVLHEYIGSQYVIGQIDCLWIQNVASQWVSYQVGNLQTRNVF